MEFSQDIPKWRNPSQAFSMQRASLVNDLYARGIHNIYGPTSFIWGNLDAVVIREIGGLIYSIINGRPDETL